MSQEAFSQPLLDPVVLGSWIATRSHIWQMNFLSAKELADFAEKRGLSPYREEHIVHFWKLGLLKADVVMSDQPLDEDGLVAVGQEENEFLYADARRPKHFQDSSIISLEDEQMDHVPLKLLFHPFRYAVLDHFERLLFRFVPIEMLFSQQYRMQERMDLWLSRLPSVQQYMQGTEQMNDRVALLVATEPCFYQHIFQTIHVSKLVYPDQDNADVMVDASFEAQDVEMEDHWNDLVNYYRAIGLEQLDQLHQLLCVFTQMLDRNRDVHTLLRLGNSTLRLKLEGRLGGAMLLRTMAEMLRRAIERAFDVQLREEDERGLGYMPEDVKEIVYGSKRFLDGNRSVGNEFLRQHGLCYGPRLRWYVHTYS